LIIVRYGEIALKGKNRKTFENKLIENIKKDARKKRYRSESSFHSR